MIGAIIKNNIVHNVIILKEAQIEELSTALKCEIVDARPYGLAVGDLRTATGWTRNAGGEQITLELLDQKAYDSYSVAASKIIELEEQNNALIEQQAVIADEAANEAIAVLMGEDE